MHIIIPGHKLLHVRIGRALCTSPGFFVVELDSQVAEFGKIDSESATSIIDVLTVQRLQN